MIVLSSDLAYTQENSVDVVTASIKRSEMVIPVSYFGNR